MIKFEIKNKETGKKETYIKEEITVGEAEDFYNHVEKKRKEFDKLREEAKKVVEAEGIEEDKEFHIQNKANQLMNGIKMRKMDRDFIVKLFADQGLTEEDILKNMGKKTYDKLQDEIFQEIEGEDEADDEIEADEEGKSEA